MIRECEYSHPLCSALNFHNAADVRFSRPELQAEAGLHVGWKHTNILVPGRCQGENAIAK